MSDQQIRFDDGSAYDQGMGRWSEVAGGQFLDWVAPPVRAHLLVAVVTHEPAQSGKLARELQLGDAGRREEARACGEQVAAHTRLQIDDRPLDPVCLPDDLIRVVGARGGRLKLDDREADDPDGAEGDQQPCPVQERKPPRKSDEVLLEHPVGIGMELENLKRTRLCLRSGCRTFSIRSISTRSRHESNRFAPPVLESQVVIACWCRRWVMAAWGVS